MACQHDELSSCDSTWHEVTKFLFIRWLIVPGQHLPCAAPHLQAEKFAKISQMLDCNLDIVEPKSINITSYSRHPAQKPIKTRGLRVYHHFRERRIKDSSPTSYWRNAV